MGFYGNVVTVNNTTFTFDKVYSNRVEMDNSVNTDGVYIGRYVLIEYDNKNDTNFIRLFKNNDEFYFAPPKDGVYQEETRAKYDKDLKEPVNNYVIKDQVAYVLEIDENGDEIYAYYRCTGNIANADYAAFTFMVAAPEGETNYFTNYYIDAGVYEKGRGYDSTVWQKVFENNKSKYVMIAELNSVVPTFDLTVDAPTMTPITPHFDADSTNVLYKLHVQPQWGFKVAHASVEDIDKTTKFETTQEDSYPSDETAFYARQVYNADTGISNTEIDDDYKAAIYYNKAGFDKKIRTISNENIKDSIKILPTGKSGAEYNTHNKENPSAKSKQIDTQELSIMLPSLGDSIAEMWDLLYGVVKLDENGKPLKDENGNYIYEENRNLNVAWDETKGLRQVNEGEMGYLLNSWETETVAGCINSIHDLMGMIIQDDPNMKVENALTNKIYYGNLENKFVNEKPYYGFYIKDLSYTYNENETPTPTKIDKIIDFEKNKYYYFTNNNYYLEENEYNSGNSYYDLTGKISTPITLIDGYKPGVYFYQEDKNYILEQSDNPGEKTYYTIDPTLMTVVSAPYKEGDKSVKLFFVPKDYITDETTGIKKGYFYLDEDDNVYRPITKDSKFSAEDFETLDFYWVENFTIEKKPNAENPNMDSLVYIVEPEDIKYSVNFVLFDSNKNYYYINDSGDYLYLNSEENIEQSITYYIFEDKAIKEIENPFYEPNTYYYLSGGKNYIFAIDKEKPVDDVYYKLTGVEIADTIFYEPNKYWYKNGQSYVIDTNPTTTKNREYYNYSELYVIEDSNGIFSKGSVWNSLIDPKEAPEGVVLGTRTENWQWKELKGFARTLNTIHGLIIEINNVLKDGDILTRDRQTVRGCINTLNDLIDKIDILKPTHFIIVDEYGRMKSSPYTSKQKYVHKSLGIVDTEKQNRSQGESENRWIELSIDDSYDNPMVTIKHSFKEEAPTETRSDKNGSKIAEDLLKGINNNTDDTLKLYTPIVDNMGHVVGQNTETVILPYGFKTIKTNGREDSENENATSVPDTTNIIANSTQDVLTINSGNKWVRIDSDSDNDIITISHDIHEVDYEAVENPTDLNDGITNAIKIPDLEFDKAGHVLSKKDHTYTLPYGFKFIATNGSSTSTEDMIAAATTIEADSTQDTLAINTHNKWIKIANNIDEDSLTIAHTVNSINIESNGTTNLNKESGAKDEENINIPDWQYDEAGHIISKKDHTYTLPYSFKFIKTESTAHDLLPILGSTTASNTQDTLTISSDKWIKVIAEEKENGDSVITVSHQSAIPPLGEIQVIDPEPPLFGESFSIPTYHFDNKGHYNAKRAFNITLPQGSLEDTTSTKATNVLTSIDFTPSTGAIKTTHENLSQLTLTGYEKINNSADVSAEDTLGQALSKLQTQIIEEEEARAAAINALDMSDENNTLFISKIIQTDGKVAVERAAAGTLKLGSDYAKAAAGQSIESTDSINSAFGKVEKRVDILDELVGDKKVELQIQRALKSALETDDKGTLKYALASDLSKTDASIELVKTSYVKKDDVFEYAYGDTKINKTIQEMYNYIAELEGRIKTLEDTITPPASE